MRTVTDKNIQDLIDKIIIDEEYSEGRIIFDNHVINLYDLGKSQVFANDTTSISIMFSGQVQVEGYQDHSENSWNETSRTVEVNKIDVVDEDNEPMDITQHQRDLIELELIATLDHV